MEENQNQIEKCREIIQHAVVPHLDTERFKELIIVEGVKPLSKRDNKLIVGFFKNIFSRFAIDGENKEKINELREFLNKVDIKEIGNLMVEMLNFENPKIEFLKSSGFEGFQLNFISENNTYLITDEGIARRYKSYLRHIKKKS